MEFYDVSYFELKTDNVEFFNTVKVYIRKKISLLIINFISYLKITWVINFTYYCTATNSSVLWEKRKIMKV